MSAGLERHEQNEVVRSVKNAFWDLFCANLQKTPRNAACQRRAFLFWLHFPFGSRSMRTEALHGCSRFLTFVEGGLRLSTFPGAQPPTVFIYDNKRGNKITIQTIHKTLHLTLHSSDFLRVTKCIVYTSNYTQTIHKPYIESQRVKETKRLRVGESTVNGQWSMVNGQRD